MVCISIHALLAESDHPQTSNHPHNRDFYPRSPCGERPHPIRIPVCVIIFLSTLSLRRATLVRLTLKSMTGHFYPRSPCGERRQTYHRYENQENISIHALLAESDVSNRSEPSSCRLFLSTLSLRRATAKVHKTVGHFCAYETNFMEIASSC